MAGKLFLVLAVAVLAGTASAQASCGSVLTSLSYCLSFIEGNSIVPTSACCTQLTIVVQLELLCLCEVLNGSASSVLGVNINETQVVELPAACNVQTACDVESVAKSLDGSPSTQAAPATPANPAPETPSPASLPSAESVSKATVGKSTASNGASFKSTPSTMITVVLAAAVCISSFAKL